MDSVKKVADESRNRTLEILKLSKDEVERGLELHRKSIVCDSLVPQASMVFTKRMQQKRNEMTEAGKSSFEVGEEIKNLADIEVSRDPETKEAYTDIWKTSGVTYINKTVARSWKSDLYAAFDRISHSQYKLDMRKDLLIKATCAEDIRKAKKEGKHAVMWMSQDAANLVGRLDLEEDLKNLDLFYAVGLRSIQLTYNLRNAVGDGCLERYESGLTRFGIKFVERMNELGMIVDTGHCGYQTTLDAVEFSKTPAIASHTTCKDIYDHPRGKTDEELKAIAEKGGYVGICTLPAFLGGTGDLTALLDHIDYAVDLIGIDHVGIGTDTGHRVARTRVSRPESERPSPMMWWTGFKPEHFARTGTRDETISGSLAWVNWPYFTVGLVSRGYSDQEIQKIIGENFLGIIEKIVG